jgi:hypothetical protein
MVSGDAAGSEERALHGSSCFPAGVTLGLALKRIMAAARSAGCGGGNSAADKRPCCTVAADAVVRWWNNGSAYGGGGACATKALASMPGWRRWSQGGQAYEWGQIRPPPPASHEAAAEAPADARHQETVAARSALAKRPDKRAAEARDPSAASAMAGSPRHRQRVYVVPVAPGTLSTGNVHETVQLPEHVVHPPGMLALDMTYVSNVSARLGLAQERVLTLLAVVLKHMGVSVSGAGLSFSSFFPTTPLAVLHVRANQSFCYNSVRKI